MLVNPPIATCPKRQPRRRGIVAPLVCVSLIALMGILALVMDVGILQDRKRDLQKAADLAALAGATDLFTYWNTNKGLDPSGTAKASAVSVASLNGYTAGSNTTVTVNVANASVGHTNSSYPTVDGVAFPAGYVEVIIIYQEQARFSAIFGASKLPIRARALARGRHVGTGDGIILLDPHASGALTIKGGGNSGAITVTNGDVVIDSDSGSAGSASGGHAIVTSSGGFVTNINGGGVTPTANFQGGPVVSASPTPDPLRALPTPDATTLGLTSQTVPNGSNFTLNPGVYSGWDFTGAGNVTLSPGNYIINGDITLAGQGTTITGNGVMIYFTGGFSTTGSWKNGGWNITAPTTGTYAGVAMFQARDSTGGFKVAGNGDITMNGTFYAPNTNVDYGGNGSITLNGQWISNQMNAHGNGSVTVNYPATGAPGPRGVTLVE